MAVTYDIAKDAVRERLGDESFGHSERVAATAAELARIYGLDVERARVAGLLHDWDRDVEGDALLTQARERGLRVSDAELRSPKLLHARTAAETLKETFPDIEPEVVRAVERHTLGAADMGPLDMVVYVADMIEPGRTFRGVDELREAAGTVSLENLFAEAYQQSVLHLVKARKPIHPGTVGIWNELVARARR